jgi:TolB-like protein
MPLQASIGERIRIMPALETERIFRFGPFELDVSMRELRTDGRRIRLQDQPFEILYLMLVRAGRVVTRAELRQRLWPEGTHVDFDHSLNAAVKRLRIALGDNAEGPTYVETLPRLGYRLVSPVSQDHVTRTVGPIARPRIAVLPFADFTEGAVQECFTDGLTEETVGQLTALVGNCSDVIARSSLMTFKRSPLRPRQIGELLGADFLVEGSVRCEGDRVRIAARLVDSASETNVGSNVYELPLTDRLAVQADIGARIARSLHADLARHLKKSNRPHSSDEEGRSSS